MVQVLAVDVGHHRDGREQVAERAVGFVGLGDQDLAAAEARVRAEGARLAADHRGRIQRGLGQDHRDHRRGRRLAVAARDRDAFLDAHQLAQHLGARDDRDVARARGGDLRVVGAHRARHDDDVGARDVLGAVADADAGAQRGQAARHVAVAQVRAGDRVAEVQQHLGDPRHADAADADEMDGDVTLSEHGKRRCSPELRAVPRLSTSRSGVPARDRGQLGDDVAGGVGAGERRPSPRPCWRGAAGSCRISSTRSPRRVADASACGSTTAAPARSNASAFIVWWSSAAVGSGIRIAGRRMIASSASVSAPARATQTARLASTAGHVVDERAHLDAPLVAERRVVDLHLGRTGRRRSGG